MPSALPYEWWRGVKMDPNSIPSLLMAESLAKCHINPSQGGYNAGGVAASAGTHDGGAVIDISIRGLTSNQIYALVLNLRRCGWAAWLRTPAQGFVWHIHAVRIGDKSASRGAQAQVVAYKNGYNGLARNGKDDGPRPGYVTWEACKYNPKNKPKAKGKPYVINGKKYPHLAVMDVSWINDARKAKNKYVSRPVHRLQTWLSYDASGKKGGFYTAKCDGVWGPKTQKAVDDYRKKMMKFTGGAAVGSVGIQTVRNLRNRVKSPYKVVN